jgi:hypothetical protein
MPAVVYKVEVEFVPGSGTYANLSARVETVTITRPRPSRLGEASPTTLEVQFQNDPDASGFCPLSPDSPVAAYYPNIDRNRLVKVTALWGASSAVRFWGWIDKWTPDAGSNPPATATVTMSASCVLSRYARRTVLSQYGEYCVQNPNFDYWPLNESPDSTTLKGYAQAGQPVNDATMVLPTQAPGSATLSAPEGGHLTDGQIEFTRGDNLNYPSPVVLVPVRSNGDVVSSFEAWFKLSTDPTGLNDDAVVAYKADGTKVWSWNAGIVAGNVVWTMYDNVGTARVTYATNSPRDDAWHFWFLQFPTSNNVNVYYSNRGNLYASAATSGPSWPYDPRAFQYLVVGGRMLPTAKGKQSNTFQGSISSFRVAYNGVLTSGQGYNDPGTSVTADQNKSFMVNSGLGVDAFVGGAVSTAGDTRRILFTNNYPNLLDRWNEHVRSTLGELITRTDGRRQLRVLGDAKPVTVTLTLDAEQDLSAPDGGWVRVRDEVPTRTNVTSGVGQVTSTRTAVETLTGQRLDGPTVDTANGDATGMAAVAAWSTYPIGGRLSSFGLDATVTSTDKLTAIMALQPLDRMRVTNLPVALQGVSYVDAFASGWVETFAADSGACTFQFDTDPADDPSVGVYDSTEYGRFGWEPGEATATGGTAIGTTTVGTLVLTATVPLTVAAGSYPLDLDWAGERVTVTAAPASSTSPQTLTLTARGVAPTVARVHAAGESVQIWRVDRFGV